MTCPSTKRVDGNPHPFVCDLPAGHEGLHAHGAPLPFMRWPETYVVGPVRNDWSRCKPDEPTKGRTRK